MAPTTERELARTDAIASIDHILQTIGEKVKIDEVELLERALNKAKNEAVAKAAAAAEEKRKADAKAKAVAEAEAALKARAAAKAKEIAKDAPSLREVSKSLSTDPTFETSLDRATRLMAEAQKGVRHLPNSETRSSPN